MTSTSPITNSNPHRWKALSILSLAQFLIILDTSIIEVAHYQQSRTIFVQVKQSYSGFSTHM